MINTFLKYFFTLRKHVLVETTFNYILSYIVFIILFITSYIYVNLINILLINQYNCFITLYVVSLPVRKHNSPNFRLLKMISDMPKNGFLHDCLVLTVVTRFSPTVITPMQIYEVSISLYWHWNIKIRLYPLLRLIIFIQYWSVSFISWMYRICDQEKNFPQTLPSYIYYTWIIVFALWGWGFRFIPPSPSSLFNFLLNYEII